VYIWTIQRGLNAGQGRYRIQGRGSRGTCQGQMRFAEYVPPCSASIPPPKLGIARDRGTSQMLPSLLFCSPSLTDAIMPK
jgi:hypothetical protein